MKSLIDRAAEAIRNYETQNGHPPKYISVKRREWAMFVNELIDTNPLIKSDNKMRTLMGVPVIFKEDVVRIK